MNKKKLTIKEFAIHLGVSTATVSRAFSDKGRISSQTRQRIINQARELGYRPNIHARSLNTSDLGSIAFFFPSISAEEPDYFITEIMQGINSTLLRLGKSLQINPFPSEKSGEALEACKDKILSGSASGAIIVAGAKGSQELVATAESCGVPYVIIGHMSSAETNTILFDNEYGAFLAGKYFKDTGRKHPAYIGGYLDRRKKRGYRKGLGRSEKEIVYAEGGTSFRHGSLAFEYLRNNHPETDCILCANDVLAIGFIKAATTAKVKIPQDIAVIGFDDIRPSRYLTPALSSVSLKLFEIGESAVNMLERILAGEKNIQSETVECDLVLRQSS
jgi:LacI family transcriptional regulator